MSEVSIFEALDNALKSTGRSGSGKLEAATLALPFIELTPEEMEFVRDFRIPSGSCQKLILWELE